MKFGKTTWWVTLLASLSIVGGCHAEEKREYALEGLTEEIYYPKIPGVLVTMSRLGAGCRTA